MAVVQPLRRPDPSGAPLAGRENVVRLVDFLGPISPELVLVDPELAPRARALLPEVPGTRGIRGSGAAWPLYPPTPRAGVRPRAVRSWAFGLAAAMLIGLSGFGLTSALESKTAPHIRSAATLPPTEPSTGPPTTQPGTVPAPQIVSPRFVWPVKRGAVGYRVAFYRDGRQVFGSDVPGTALELPTGWSFDGRLYRLERGSYRWVVWALYGSDKAPRGKPIVSANYTA